MRSGDTVTKSAVAFGMEPETEKAHYEKTSKI